MFETIHFLERETEQRLRRDRLLHAMPPDEGWLARLWRRLAERKGPGAPELFVPDDRIALLVQGAALFRPGLHRFPAVPMGELRWITLEALRGHAPQDFWTLAPAEQARLALRMPYERAQLFLDGRVVALFRPAKDAESSAWSRFQALLEREPGEDGQPEGYTFV